MNSTNVDQSLTGIGAYRTPQSAFPVRLRLDRNEGRLPPELAAQFWQQSASLLNRYPDTSELAALVAMREGIDTTCVLITAGGDDALNRICQTYLSADDEMVLPVPTFEMLERYCLLAGGKPVFVPGNEDEFPTDDVLKRVTSRTKLMAIVSPNNPTGSVISETELRRIAAANPDVILIVDLAYTEFADVDLSSVATKLTNAIVIKTFSKAWGMAGLRVGCAIARPNIIERLGAVGNPYPVAGLSAAIVAQRLKLPADWIDEHVSRIRHERERLTLLLRERGIVVRSSQANFVLATFEDAHAVWLDLARQGIAVRRFERPQELHSSLRITLPGSVEEFQMLHQALVNCLLKHEQKR